MSKCKITCKKCIKFYSRREGQDVGAEPVKVEGLKVSVHRFRGGSVLEMAKYFLLFTLQLLFGLIRPSLLQNISADLISVSPGANITLLCNITNYSQKSWYQMISAGLRQIISARQSSLNKHFHSEYNVDKSHFDVTESSSLVIIGVRETDLGFYYCGGRNDETHIQFGKLIRLNFTGGSNNESSSEASDSQPPARNGTCWITNLILICVCSISVLIICMCVFCSRVLDAAVTSPISTNK
ncbi:uncharacterized protein LOC124392180 isoform X2 [Silurus meridionalis]|uniref:uncharacterized protein LOC124392180 isoform X2 n=1 Tax=Silurus meridionalis TaxID=175797 RepID=UPI001EEB1FCD|nr:uncharacterized protein LOC124392180 isoform X2 [Silurus meridionalis]